MVKKCNIFYLSKGYWNVCLFGLSDSVISRQVNTGRALVFIPWSLADLSIDQHFHDVVNKPTMWGDWESHELSKDTEIHPLYRLDSVYSL